MQTYNVLSLFDVEKWRGLIRDFDVKRIAFVNEIASLRNVRGANAALESERQALLAKASPIQAQVNGLYSTLKTVREWLDKIGFSLGEAQAQQMGLAPIAIGISVGAAALIVNSITNWLRDAAAFAAKNRQIDALVKAGGTPEQVARAISSGSGQSSAKLFGFDVRWVLAIGALFIAGPYVIKGFEKYRVLK